MSFLEKIETFINNLLIKIGQFFISFISKITPQKIKNFFHYLTAVRKSFREKLKSTPAYIVHLIKSFLIALKEKASSINIKEALTSTYQSALANYKERNPDKKLGNLKRKVLAPFLVISRWLNGLTAGQSLMLLTFTAGSILSAIGIGFSSKKLISQHMNTNRAPASIEEEILYDRPEYYKKQTKHFSVTNIRLPVYIAEVNELKSVDIDFTATLSNRQSKMFLLKYEWQVRDHLILNIEPSVASFPLEDEGKEIIRIKILAELNDFLKLHQVEGEVEELKITYILAN